MYYDPDTGRFLLPDPLGLDPAQSSFAHRKQIQYSDGLNLYQYADSRPLYKTDPLGLSCRFTGRYQVEQKPYNSYVLGPIGFNPSPWDILKCLLNFKRVHKVNLTCNCEKICCKPRIVRTTLVIYEGEEIPGVGKIVIEIPVFGIEFVSVFSWEAQYTKTFFAGQESFQTNEEAFRDQYKIILSKFCQKGAGLDDVEFGCGNTVGEMGKEWLCQDIDKTVDRFIDSIKMPSYNFQERYNQFISGCSSHCMRKAVR
ncbi:MAG: hypothetical protein WHS88_12560 [Anaerohalosphaeraceae bacterium]